MTTKERTLINVPNLCPTHLSLFVHGAGLAKEEPWRTFVLAAQIALFQAATTDPQAHARMDGKIERLPELGCLACFKPDAFGEIVEVAKTRDIGAIKALGERWIAQARRIE